MQKQESGLLTDADFEKLRADVIADQRQPPSAMPGFPQGPQTVPPPMGSPMDQAQR